MRLILEVYRTRLEAGDAFLKSLRAHDPGAVTLESATNEKREIVDPATSTRRRFVQIVSVDDIYRLSGLPISAVHYHYPIREELRNRLNLLIRS